MTSGGGERSKRTWSVLMGDRLREVFSATDDSPLFQSWATLSDDQVDALRPVFGATAALAAAVEREDCALFALAYVEGMQSAIAIVDAGYARLLGKVAQDLSEAIARRGDRT